MIIPLESLSDEARQGLVDEYCMRENGSNETEDPLEACRQGVEKALSEGRLLVLYTPYNPNQVAALVPADQLGEKEKAEVYEEPGGSSE
ncbi:uncharacterized protein UPF0270 [Halospina denitrificans]|uniref:Uncharacterized protein UPF0270 n=1 Tax=Halospina denitrificans TaxID=332522 RepID=A0A4R7JN65_9GAMM|nr:YheU family protein [Halospina denitrificans]TDT38563.1 uncharacterized protein UPF0270 [Halospina denitrificans]